MSKKGIYGCFFCGTPFVGGDVPDRVIESDHLKAENDLLRAAVWELEEMVGELELRLQQAQGENVRLEIDGIKWAGLVKVWENREAVAVRRQWMAIIGCDSEEIEELCSGAVDLSLKVELEQLSAAIANNA